MYRCRGSKRQRVVGEAAVGEMCFKTVLGRRVLHFPSDGVEDDGSGVLRRSLSVSLRLGPSSSTLGDEVTASTLSLVCRAGVGMPLLLSLVIGDAV